MSVVWPSLIRPTLADRRVWRPWGLAVPLLCLLIALPLLRPLTHPAGMGEEELLLVQTARSFVHGRGGALPESVTHAVSGGIVATDGNLYATQPPMLAVLLAGSSKLLDRVGVPFEHSPDRHLYLLTLIAAALPVAAAAGGAYRIGRMFELRRSWRTILAAAVVFGSGWISYATVLNPHAPAAALLIAGLAAVVHVAAASKPRAWLWYLPAGLMLALAATIDPFTLPAVVVTALSPLVLRRAVGIRLAGLALIVAGAAGPVLIHQTLAAEPAALWSARAALRVVPATPRGEEAEAPDSIWLAAGQHAERLTAVTVGDHGIFSHFPVLLIGLAGLGTTLRRHWPTTQKLLAFAAGFALATALVAVTAWPVDWSRAMFACRWIIPVLPMVMLFAGAWLKRSHHPASWTIAAMALAWSVVVSLVGATGPMPPGGFDRYTAWQAARRNFAPEPANVLPDPLVLK